MLFIAVKRQEKRLTVITTSNAISPLLWDDIVSQCSILCTRFFYSLKFDSPYFVVQPIICLDMWEVSNTFLPSSIFVLFLHLNRSYIIHDNIWLFFFPFPPACLLSGLQGMKKLNSFWPRTSTCSNLIIVLSMNLKVSSYG